MASPTPAKVGSACRESSTTRLRQAVPLDQKVRELIALANQQGGRDNIAVLLVQASDKPAKRNLLSRLLGR